MDFRGGLSAARLALLGAFSALGASLVAATPVSGPVSGEWTAGGSPYIVGSEVQVPAGASLAVGPGVEVAFGPDASLEVRGELRVEGTREAPVRFARRVASEPWGGVVIRGGAASAGVRHLELTGAATAPDYPAAFNVRGGAQVEISDSWFHDFPAVVIDSTGGSHLTVRDSLIESSKEAIHSADGYALVEGVTIRNVFGYADCIDFDGESVPRSVIRNCLLDTNLEDDGIDLGGSSALVEDVVIRGVVAGKAISIDGDCSPVLRRLLIYDSMLGLVVKDSSRPSFEQCTVTLCETGVKCYEKTPGRGGGHGSAESLIIWGNETAVELDALSTFTLTYSIAEGGYPGEGNLDADPLFVSAAGRDFYLQPGSPAAGAGRDGADMGALPVATGVPFVRGEANGDARVDLSDAVTILLHLFAGREATACLDALDVDDTGGVALTDPVYLLRFLYRRGPAMPPPYPGAGYDPTTDDPYECPVAGEPPGGAG